MRLTPSQLRANIYRVLDRVVRTGRGVDVVRRGRRVRIMPSYGSRKLASLIRRSISRVVPDALVHVDWSRQWRARLPE